MIYEQELVDGDKNEFEMEEELSKNLEEVVNAVLRRIPPIEFVVWDIKEDRPLPIIMGKPFLTKTQVLLDLERGEISLDIMNDKPFQNSRTYPKSVAEL